MTGLLGVMNISETARNLSPAYWKAILLKFHQYNWYVSSGYYTVSR